MRVKGGVARRRRHNRVLERTKGFRMTKGRLYKVSKEADLHAGQYAYVGRRKRKRDLRRLWIQRINAGLSNLEVSYSSLINKLKKSKITLDRKILAELSTSYPQVFKEIIKKAS